MIELGDFTPAALLPAAQKFHERVMAGDREVLFRVNSFGGSVFAGLDLIQAVTDARARGLRVRCVVDTKAMSMGFVFLQTACDERMMTKRSTLLAHNGVLNGLPIGSARELDEAREMLHALDDAMSAVCAARLHLSLPEYRAKLRRHAWVMAYEEALAVGAVDRIVDPLLLPPVYLLASN